MPSRIVFDKTVNSIDNRKRSQNISVVHLMKKFQYQVLAGRSPEELALLVTDALNQGWQLEGSISVVHVPDTHLLRYYQAMTKEGKVTKKRASKK